MGIALKMMGLGALVFAGFAAGAQPVHKPHSVLASGPWAKIAVREAGVYKLDMGILKSLGFLASIPAGQLQVWGRREAVLPEAVSTARTDDLEELDIQVQDGGDGVLNGADYALFFAEGPDSWNNDAQRQLRHQKNLYSNRRYYYITVKEDGRRMPLQTTAPAATVTISTFDEHLFHELDSVNFLASGKEWYGEAFADAPGQTLTQLFQAPMPGAVSGTPATLVSNVAARSIGSASRFDVKLGSESIQQLTVPATTAGPYSPFAQEAQEQSTAIIRQPDAALSYTYGNGGFNAQGWLNWFEVFYTRTLALPQSGQLLFRNLASGGAVGFSLGNADAATQVWDVTDPFTPVQLKTTVAGNLVSFSNNAAGLREYMGFLKSLTPEAIGPVPNQDLHNTTETDYFIITPPGFLTQAQRLAQLHQERDKLRVTVVTTDQIFNEFSAGIPDPSALRDFVKLYYDRYRATWSLAPKYLLLFGKGSFDFKARISNNTALVPVYESAVSLDPLNTYTSDDFFGFLEEGEDVNATTAAATLDIGIGRVPVKTADEAKAFVDKVEAYQSPQAFGPWRTNLTFVADDEDANLHLQDAEAIAATAQRTAPLFNVQKIYFDAYKQEGGSAGSRYPQATEASSNALLTGTLIWNYSGHGGPARLAEEVILDQQIVNNFKNPYRLPLFVTATCDFAPYDNPTVASLGENLLIRPRTGTIALTTTTRLVFAFSNRILNDNYIAVALKRDAGGAYKSLGEALRVAKNVTYQSGTDAVNNRKFALLGDPALTLAFPRLQVRATTINGMDISKTLDTLSATEDVTLGGDVRTNEGDLLPNFNGTVYLSLFDKPQTVTTLGNDAASTPVPFQTQSSVLFRGKASATGGKFLFRFRLPKDLNYAFGRGKISLYAADDKQDGAGASDSVVIGGIARKGLADNTGPSIKAYLNDEQFAPGGIANSAPVLIVKLADSSGINSSGTGIGHDIIATLDGDNKTYYLLNAFYESNVDDAHRGAIRFQLPELPAGPHTLTIKAWDVLNNSAEYSLAFTVTPTADLQIAHVLNYPNPFTTRTAFWFEHNQPGQDLAVRVDIFTVSGRRIKTISQTINTGGNRSSDVEWDGRDDQGARVGRGVYLYRLQVRTAGGQTAGKWERLVLLN